jgi:RNA polymerase sigma factor (sigma-70 family)
VIAGRQSDRETPRMSGADLEELEAVSGLIERGLQFGVLTHVEIAIAAADLGLEEIDIEELHGVLENLSYRERRVLELRYGLGDQDPRTLDEVGRTFNVTRERIRQIEHRALKKLQTLQEAQLLRQDVEIASAYWPRPLRRHT